METPVRVIGAVFVSRNNYQPAREVMYAQRWSAALLAEEIGVSYGHLRCVLAGTSALSPEVREKLPQILGTPLEELFSPELLARQYHGRRDQYAHRRARAKS